MPATTARKSTKPARPAPRKAPAVAAGFASPPPSVVNVHEAKTQLSRLLARVAAGEEITIARAGQPLARIVPLSPRGARVPGRFKGMFGPLTPEEALAPLPPAFTGLVSSPTDPLHRP